VLPPNQVGVVSIVIGSGAKSFSSSKRNGVTTRSYGAWGTSYTFARDAAPGTISWRTAWSQIPAEFSGPIALQCPAGGALAGIVWGTDVYTKDSALCVAAVHAGVITADRGGLVVATRARQAGAFPASLRNGVTSLSWGNTQDAFSVTVAAAGGAVGATAATLAAAPPASLAVPTATVAVAPGAQSAPTAPIGASTGSARIATQDTAALQRGAPAPTGAGPRTIRVAALTAEGSSPGPRTLRLAAIAAQGTSSGPRTIQTPSITGAGSAPGP
jgi:hypothetical protein